MGVAIVIRVRDIVMPPSGTSGYAAVTVAEDETEPDWVDTEVWVDAFNKPDAAARKAAESQFTTERWTLLHQDLLPDGEQVLTYGA